MKRLMLIGILLLSVASVSALHTSQSTKFLSASLWSGDATGLVTVRVYHQSRDSSVARIETRALPYLGKGGVYEAWFVNSEFDYWQSAGIFQSTLIERTLMTYTIQDDLGLFDRFVITQEPARDHDPRPGKAVLEGEFGQQTRRRFTSNLPYPPRPDYRYSEESITYRAYPLAKG